MSALAASIRNWGLLVRAGGPRRSQASSLRMQVRAALLGDRREPVALGAGEDVRRIPSLEGLDRPVGHLPRQRRDRVEEPPVVRDRDESRPGGAAGSRGGRPARRPPRRRGGWSARRGAAGRGRRRAGGPARAGVARPRTWSDDGCRARPCPRRPCPPSSPSSTSRIRGSPAHTCSGRSPTTASRTVHAGSSASTWLQQADRGRRPPVVTRPASAPGRRPAPAAASTCRRRCDRRRRSGRRSPTPRRDLVEHGAVPKTTDAFSRATRLAMGG